MQAQPRPNPITDELSDEAKAALAKTFEALRQHYSFEGVSWRVRARLQNVTSTQRFHLDHETGLW